MAKFSLPSQSNAGKKLTTSLRVPVSMLDKIEIDMAASGFNKKQRTQWLHMVIGELLSRSDYANLIAEEFMLPGSTEAIPIVIPEELDLAMSSALEQVRLTENMTKDRSALIRTAITQRLMARAGQQVSPIDLLNIKIAQLGAVE